MLRHITPPWCWIFSYNNVPHCVFYSFNQKQSLVEVRPLEPTAHTTFYRGLLQGQEERVVPVLFEFETLQKSSSVSLLKKQLEFGFPKRCVTFSLMQVKPFFNFLSPPSQSDHSFRVDQAWGMCVCVCGRYVLWRQVCAYALSLGLNQAVFSYFLLPDSPCSVAQAQVSIAVVFTSATATGYDLLECW